MQIYLYLLWNVFLFQIFGSIVNLKNDKKITSLKKKTQNTNLLGSRVLIHLKKNVDLPFQITKENSVLTVN